MFFKIIPRNSSGFEVQVTDNLRWQAPIPLCPEPDTGETKIKKVKVKLRRNPTVGSSTTYEKSYTLWTGHTIEGYCKFRAILDEYIKQAPLNNVNEWVNAISLLLSVTPLSNWQNLPSQFLEDHIWDKNSFYEALRAFALNYCSSMACQEQKRFMKRHLGLPSRQITTTLLSRIQQFNGFLPYLPGTGNKFDADDVREIVYNALSTYVHTIIVTSYYK
jgi:hypothetical protein